MNKYPADMVQTILKRAENSSHKNMPSSFSCLKAYLEVGENELRTIRTRKNLRHLCSRSEPLPTIIEFSEGTNYLLEQPKILATKFGLHSLPHQSMSTHKLSQYIQPDKEQEKEACLQTITIKLQSILDHVTKQQFIEFD